MSNPIQFKLTCCGHIVHIEDCNVECPKCGSGEGMCEEVPKRERIFMNPPPYSGDKRYEQREWGNFEVLLDEPNMKVKKIVVSTGKRLSLQLHKKREELWYIASGSGEVQKGNTFIDISAGDQISIGKYEVHRVRNNGLIDLVIIEIQTGICQEDDIIRIEDDFGRVE
jgi:mannose-6-phosphate isomerase